MALIAQDIPHLEWRASEAGCTIDELRRPRFQDMLTPDVDAHTYNSADQNTPVAPVSHILPRGNSNELYPIGDTRIAFVGAGAGSILLASYLSRRGAQVENMTIVNSTYAKSVSSNR